jgi:hypothetical protein
MEMDTDTDGYGSHADSPVGAGFGQQTKGLDGAMGGGGDYSFGGGSGGFGFGPGAEEDGMEEDMGGSGPHSEYSARSVFVHSPSDTERTN